MFQDRIKIPLLVSILILNVLTLVALLKKNPLILKKGPAFDQKHAVEDICYFGIKSLIAKQIEPYLFEPSLKEIILSKNYDPLDLTGTETISNIKSHDQQCRIITKDSKGLRYWDFFLEDSEKFPALYQINKIEEKEGP